jgi:arylsulfatase A-like enzyme
MNLMPWLTQGAALESRKLFWRYKYGDQQAARDGDWKYLKILDNTFLFDVVQDPMERANLKERHRDV